MGKEQQQYDSELPPLLEPLTRELNPDNAQYHQPPPSGAYGAQYSAPQYQPQYVVHMHEPSWG
jgi:hypothetical protein